MAVADQTGAGAVAAQNSGERTAGRAPGEDDRVRPLRTRGEPRGVEAELSGFRAEIVVELLAMARHLTGGAGTEALGEAATGALAALDRGEAPPLDDLLTAHHELKLKVAPATPGALAAKGDSTSARGLFRFLGPNPIVRQLTLANLFFLALFFGVSLSPMINIETLQLSIYEQSGAALGIKLLFLVAAAGLGASFGALFDVWDELRTERFNPRAESLHWMKVGLGIVAGLALTEIFQTTAPGAETSPAGPALLALVGGFSAGLLHIALSRMVNAVKSIFVPPNDR